jgi:hypothetical protein
MPGINNKVYLMDKYDGKHHRRLGSLVGAGLGEVRSHLFLNHPLQHLSPLCYSNTFLRLFFFFPFSLALQIQVEISCSATLVLLEKVARIINIHGQPSSLYDVRPITPSGTPGVQVGIKTRTTLRFRCVCVLLSFSFVVFSIRTSSYRPSNRNPAGNVLLSNRSMLVIEQSNSEA